MKMPARKQIKDLFEGMLGRDVAIGDARELLGPDTVPAPALAVYVDDAGRTSAVALMDFSLVAHTGAALALVPVFGAEDAIATSAMPDSLMENTSEVFNVMAAPLGDASGVHQRLERTYGPHEQLPTELAVLAATLGAREDVVVDIAGYGGGRLAVVSVPEA